MQRRMSIEERNIHIKTQDEYLKELRSHLKENLSVKEPKQILDTFPIENYKLFLIQVNIDGIDKFGVELYCSNVGNALSYCDLYNKKELASSLYNKICEDLKARKI